VCNRPVRSVRATCNYCGAVDAGITSELHECRLCGSGDLSVSFTPAVELMPEDPDERPYIWELP
jgi:hypothetical protein